MLIEFNYIYEMRFDSPKLESQNLNKPELI